MSAAVTQSFSHRHEALKQKPLEITLKGPTLTLGLFSHSQSDSNPYVLTGSTTPQVSVAHDTSHVAVAV